MILKSFSLMLIVFVSFNACNSSVKQGAKKAATEAAESWLVLIDSAKYAESWEKTSSFFQEAVDLESWIKSMQAMRAPMGQLVSREIKSSQYETSLPGAPDGEYVVIQFNTSFEKKKSAIETVTPMLEKDGKWRVSGYYIK